MKKILLLVACFIASVGSVGAMENIGDISLLNIPYSDAELDEIAKTKDYFEIASDTKYIITSYTRNSNGDIIDENSVVTTEEMARKVAEDDTLFVGANGKIQQKRGISTFALTETDVVETESKKVNLIYIYDSGYYKVGVRTEWVKLPKIRVFDISALRWTKNVTLSKVVGTQWSDEKTTKYDETTQNLKKGNNAIGLSMNLHNNAKSELITEFVISSKTPYGDVYGTYQHARHSNATLAISKSYTFDSKGLGGVVYFSNSTYKSYYDNTPGLKILNK